MPAKTASTRPYVLAHVAVSLDGMTSGFEADVARFYQLAQTWKEDVTLIGADTILAQEPALAAHPGPGPAADGPLLVVVDGRGRVREWEALRDAGHWSAVMALYTRTTPPRPPERRIRELVLGDEKVDLAAALHALGERHGATTVRVDSGGSLIGAMLGQGLIDEISLLVHPLLAGPEHRHHWYGAQPPPVTLELIAAEALDGGLVWLRYRLDTAMAAESAAAQREVE